MKLIVTLVLLSGLVSFVATNPPGKPSTSVAPPTSSTEEGEEEYEDDYSSDRPTIQCLADRADFRWPNNATKCRIIRRTVVSRCIPGVPGENDMVHLTNSFSDCVDYEAMGYVLAARFWMVPLPRLFLKFFKWITMSTPHDYKSAGTQCFFRILLKMKIPHQYLARLAEDKPNLCKMQIEIPDDSYLLATDMLSDPTQTAIRLPTSLAYFAANVYDVLGPIALGIALDPSIATSIIEAVMAIAQSTLRLDKLDSILAAAGMGKSLEKTPDSEIIDPDTRKVLKPGHGGPHKGGDGPGQGHHGEQGQGDHGEQGPGRQGPPKMGSSGIRPLK